MPENNEKEVKPETGACLDLVELKPPSPERQAEMAKDTRAIKTDEDVKNFRDKYSEEEIRWVVGDWGDEQKKPLSEREQERLIGILRVHHRNENLKGRLERLNMEAELLHKVAVLSDGLGSHRLTTTGGALKAIKIAGETLLAEKDPTMQQVTAQVVRELIRTTLFGFTVATNKSGEFLLYGGVEEVMRRYPHLELEFLDVLKGTRVEILRQFLKRQGADETFLNKRLNSLGE